MIWLQNLRIYNNLFQNLYRLIILKDPLLNILNKNLKIYNKNLFDLYFKYF